MHALPDVDTFSAPAPWRAIDFISDLHLDAEHPRTFEAWRQHLLHTPADAVLQLGDLFEVWVGDDARDSGFELKCAQVLEAAAGRLHLGFMAGNRDFLVGEDLLRACGMRGWRDPTLLQAFGRRLLLTHGDALCLDDTDYQRFRTEVRSAAWQQAFLSRPLAERRAIARGLREASEAAKARQEPVEWADVDPPAAVAWLEAAGTTEMIHGHTHRPGSGPLAPGYERHVLSDWDLDAAAPRAEVLRLSARGLERLTLAQALAPL